MKYLYAAIVCLVCGFIVGYMYKNSQIQRAQVTALKRDAKELPKIEERDKQRETTIRTVIAKAKQDRPADCFSQPISDDSIKRLSDGGLKAR